MPVDQRTLGATHDRRDAGGLPGRVTQMCFAPHIARRNLLSLIVQSPSGTAPGKLEVEATIRKASTAVAARHPVAAGGKHDIAGIGQYL